MRTTSSVLGVFAVVLAGCNSDSGIKTYNSEPSVTIKAPIDGTSYGDDDEIEFTGVVADSDNSNDELSVTWTSDIDGVLLDDAELDADGITTFLIDGMTPGNHVITLLAIDVEGDSAEDTVEITVQEIDQDPVISMVHPTPSEYCLEGDDFTFVADVSDEQDDPEDLVVSFESDIDGVFCEPQPDSVGVAECDYSLSGGDHILTFTVTDSDGNTAMEDALFPCTSEADQDNDGDGWTENQGDCDDNDETISPEGEETGNEDDDDCDGIVDEGTDVYDDDGDCDCEDADDCYGSSNDECDELGHGDCDDDDEDVYEGAEEDDNGVDDDCDDIIDEGTDAYDDDGDGYSELDGDCDDDDATVSPDADEICDGVDNDCDGDIDDDDDSVDTSTGTTYYADSDNDGYGDPDSTTMACDVPSGYVENDDDCDDADAHISPSETEICDEIDNDCDGDIDDDDSSLDTSTGETFYEDGDDDTYGDPDSTTMACEVPDGYSENDDDCDDGDDGINPDATEVCDLEDNDCDGLIDDDDSSLDTSTGDTFYEDDDGDGYGDAADDIMACNTPSGYVDNDDDCDDGESAVNPAATEVCDEIDNDCDDDIDDEDSDLDTSTGNTYYADDDEDGFGDASSTTMACDLPSGYVEDSDDCNDRNEDINPDADEYCDGSDDEDCDGTIDEDGAVDAGTWYQDNDEDGYGVDDTTTVSCYQPEFYADNDDDCDDTDTALYPFDEWETSGTYGDSSGDPVDEWSTLDDDGTTTATITGYLHDTNDDDWYYINTDQTSVTAGGTGYNDYHFQVEMTDGTDDYRFIVYRDSTIECSSGTYGYTEYDFFAEDVGDGSHSITSAGANGYCAASSSAYNECEDLSAAYLIQIVRRSDSTDYCATYTLEVTNADASADRDTGDWDTGS